MQSQTHPFEDSLYLLLCRAPVICYVYAFHVISDTLKTVRNVDDASLLIEGSDIDDVITTMNSGLKPL